MPWTPAKDTALVQFVALHTDYLKEPKCSPSFGARHAYWREAADNLNQTVPSASHSRSRNKK